MDAGVDKIRIEESLAVEGMEERPRTPVKRGAALDKRDKDFFRKAVGTSETDLLNPDRKMQSRPSPEMSRPSPDRIRKSYDGISGEVQLRKHPSKQNIPTQDQNLSFSNSSDSYNKIPNHNRGLNSSLPSDFMSRRSTGEQIFNLDDAGRKSDPIVSSTERTSGVFSAELAVLTDSHHDDLSSDSNRHQSSDSNRHLSSDTNKYLSSDSNKYKSPVASFNKYPSSASLSVDSEASKCFINEKHLGVVNAEEAFARFRSSKDGQNMGRLEDKVKGFHLEKRESPLRDVTLREKKSPLRDRERKSPLRDVRESLTRDREQESPLKDRDPLTRDPLTRDSLTRDVPFRERDSPLRDVPLRDKVRAERRASSEQSDQMKWEDGMGGE